MPGFWCQTDNKQPGREMNELHKGHQWEGMAGEGINELHEGHAPTVRLLSTAYQIPVQSIYMEIASCLAMQRVVMRHDAGQCKE